MNAIKAWFHERLPISGAQLQEFTNEPVPNHLRRWWFCLGGTPAYLFVVQIFTGILLAVYYQPSPATAYKSVGYITNEVAASSSTGDCRGVSRHRCDSLGVRRSTQGRKLSTGIVSSTRSC